MFPNQFICYTLVSFSLSWASRFGCTYDQIIWSCSDS